MRVDGEEIWSECANRVCPVHEARSSTLTSGSRRRGNGDKSPDQERGTAVRLGFRLV